MARITRAWVSLQILQFQFLLQRTDTDLVNEWDWFFHCASALTWVFLWYPAKIRAKLPQIVSTYTYLKGKITKGEVKSKQFISLCMSKVAAYAFWAKQKKLPWRCHPSSFGWAVTGIWSQLLTIKREQDPKSKSACKRMYGNELASPKLVRI